MHLNDGTGVFLTSLPFGTGAHSSVALAVGDFDSNGFVDIAVANQGQPNAFYKNDGLGNFTQVLLLDESGQPQPTVSTSIVVGDYNADGALDIIIGNAQGETSEIYLNEVDAQTGANGTSRFLYSGTLERSSNNAPDTRALACGDWDRDGKLDIVMGNQRSSSRVYLQNEALFFSPANSKYGYVYDWAVPGIGIESAALLNVWHDTLRDTGASSNQTGGFHKPGVETDGFGHWLISWPTQDKLQYPTDPYTGIPRAHQPHPADLAFRRTNHRHRHLHHQQCLWQATIRLPNRYTESLPGNNDTHHGRCTPGPRTDDGQAL